MDSEYRILIVEDLPTDVLLVERELKKVLAKFTIKVVETEGDFLIALEQFNPDLVISDYQMPGFNGLTALNITLKKAPLTPVIIATGSMNEETAVLCMKSGASDYVIKEHLLRLGPAVINALEQKKNKEEKIQAEATLKEKDKALQRSEERYRTIARMSSEFAYSCIYNDDNKYTVDWITDAFFTISGYTESELQKQGCWMFITHPDDREFATEPLRKLKIRENDIRQFRIITKAGNVLYIINHMECLEDLQAPGGIRLYGAVLDITQQKQIEKKLKENEEKFRTIFEGSPIGIELYDSNGFQITANKASFEIFGIHDDSSAGFNLFEGTSLNEELKQKLRQGETISYQIAFDFDRVRKLKQYNTSRTGKGEMEYVITPLQGHEKENFMGYLLQVQEITERKKAEKIQQVLYNISNAIVTTRDVEELIGIIRKELGTLVDTTNFFVAFFDETTGMLSSPYTQDEKDEMTSWSAAESMTGYVIKQNKPILVTPKESKELVRSGIIKIIGNPSMCWLGVPMHMDGKVIGAFVVQSYDNPQAYSEKDMEILEFISDQISLSIQRKQTEQDLIMAKEKAQESDRLKSAFLANMSHEIRTPMNAIVGFTEMLSDPTLSVDLRLRYCDIIQSRSDDLLHLVNDILEISRIESGNITIMTSKVNLNLLVEEIEMVSREKLHRANKSHLRLTLHKPLLSGNDLLFSDPYILKQVFFNLIDNAIKFTDFGEISFGYQLPENGLLTCFVTDTGIGISSENQQIIFEHFRQGDLHNSRIYGGTGLGLSICKGSLSLLGGNIRVESIPGKGSTFYFTLPFILPDAAIPDSSFGKQHPQPQLSKKQSLLQEEKDQPASSPVRQVNGIYNWSDKKILLVEDEPSNMEFLTIILGRTGAELVCAYNGKELRNYFGQLDSFDLVLLDVRLPDASGWELTKEIKAIRPELTVISQTAYAMSTDREKSKSVGCDDYISKPINKNQFLELLSKYLGKPSKNTKN
ncbi:MAG: response regulator [Bacteroidales bacterium]|nr:response regulator [Bacteroidales bacterium]